MTTDPPSGDQKRLVTLSTVVFVVVVACAIYGRKSRGEPTFQAAAPKPRSYVATPVHSPPLLPPRSALIREAVNEVNKSAPMMVDKTTQLMNATGVGDAIVYHYRLTNITLDKIEPAKVAQLLRPSVKNGVCSNPSTRNGVLGNGITMRYAYHDRYGSYITAFEIAPGDCAN